MKLTEPIKETFNEPPITHPQHPLNFQLGPLMTVKLNGNVTATLNNNKFPSGPFALQFGAGVNNAVGGPIQWRNVMIKPN